MVRRGIPLRTLTMTRIDYKINGTLKRRILARLGRKTGKVTINEEQWDDGFCETCSYPEDGFSVHVDGETVWPSSDYLEEFGGRYDADRDGFITGRTLSTFGQFDAWLNERPWDDEE